jgi:Na+-transporting methylmalonyl-CoA/oxaloacetate decarboxylase beta subunit
MVAGQSASKTRKSLPAELIIAARHYKWTLNTLQSNALHKVSSRQELIFALLAAAVLSLLFPVNKQAIILLVAMGPNVAGVITTAIIAGFYVGLLR